MSNTILEQQVALHFGDEYGPTRAIVRNYTSQMDKFMRSIGMKYWVRAEGGWPQVQWNCLMYIVEEGDVDRGLKAYASYVNREYANRDQRIEMLSLNYSGPEEFMDEWVDLLEDPNPFGGVGSSEQTLQGSSAARLERFQLSEEEAAVFQALGDNNMSTVEAAAALGVSVKEVRKVYRRVHARRRYAESDTVKHRRKANAARYRS